MKISIFLVRLASFFLTSPAASVFARLLGSPMNSADRFALRSTPTSKPLFAIDSSIAWLTVSTVPFRCPHAVITPRRLSVILLLKEMAGFGQLAERIE